MLPSLLARRPLLVHCAWGAAAYSAAEFAASPPADGPVDPLEIVSGLAATTLVGAAQGGLMRAWYPLLETTALRLYGTRSAALLTKIALDIAPAALSTLGVHVLLRNIYAHEIGGLVDPYSLLSRYEALRADLEEEVARWPGAAAGEGVDLSDPDLPPNVSKMWDELELLDSIIAYAPTIANPLTALCSVLVFSVVPRQLRGLAGTTQWICYDALREQLGWGEPEEEEYR